MSPKAKKGAAALRGNASPDSRVKEFIDYAYQTYLDKYGVGLVISAADAAQVKRILGAISNLDLLKRYWNFFLHYKGRDYIFATATRDIKTFGAHINRITQKLRPKPDVGAGFIPARKPREGTSPSPTKGVHNALKLWNKATIRLQSQMDNAAYRTWIEPLAVAGLDGDTLKLAAPTAFAADWVRDNYAEQITVALGGRKFELIVAEGGE